MDQVEPANRQQNRYKGTQYILNIANHRVRHDLQQLATNRYSTNDTNLYIHMPFYNRFMQCIPISIQVKQNTDNIYAGAWFHCIIFVDPGYPYYPPSQIFLRNNVYHPNVDFFSNELYIELLCAKEWKSNFTLNSIIFAIELLLLEPNLRYFPQNCVNLEMVQNYKSDKELFRKKVLHTIRGGWAYNKYFEPNYGDLCSRKTKRDSFDILKTTKRVKQ